MKKTETRFPKNRPASLAEVALWIHQGVETSIAIGEFLDAYFASPHEAHGGFLETRPDSVALSDPWKTQVIDAYLSAMAECLSYRDGCPAPAWVFDARFFLDKPWFASPIDGLRPLLLMESPVCFRRTNLFVSKNALSRA